MFLYNHCVNTHSSLSFRAFVWSRPRIKTRRYDSLMDRSIEVSRQLEKVFDPYFMVITEMKGGEKMLRSQRVSARKRDTLKILKPRFLGRGQISRIFAFRWWSSNPPPVNRNECGHIYVHIH